MFQSMCFVRGVPRWSKSNWKQRNWRKPPLCAAAGRQLVIYSVGSGRWRPGRHCPQSTVAPSRDSWECFVKALKAGTKNWKKRKEHRPKKVAMSWKEFHLNTTTFIESAHIEVQGATKVCSWKGHLGGQFAASTMSPSGHCHTAHPPSSLAS